MSLAKVSGLVMINIECDVFYIKMKIAINMQKLEVSEVSNGLYCNSNVNCETENYTANLFFIW